MAISRTQWIDDDGSGTTGTVINNAEKTLLYDQIDAALALLIPKTGGGAITTYASGVYIGGPTPVDPGANNLAVAGTVFVNTVKDGTASGLKLSAEHSSGVIRFYSGGTTERGQFSATGAFILTGDAAAGSRFQMVNTSTGNTGVYVHFFNAAAGVAGSITQTNATTVAYNTTSDARLKMDCGIASDLTELQTVVVHDFAWLADGSPDRGVFAQEAHAVFPRAVCVGSDGDDLSKPWMTDYSKFVPDLIVGWQQHDARIAALEAMLVCQP